MCHLDALMRLFETERLLQSSIYDVFLVNQILTAFFAIFQNNLFFRRPTCVNGFLLLFLNYSNFSQFLGECFLSRPGLLYHYASYSTQKSIVFETMNG